MWYSLLLPVNSLWPVHTLDLLACLDLELFWRADEQDLAACLTRFNIPRHGQASKTGGKIALLLGDEFQKTKQWFVEVNTDTVLYLADSRWEDFPGFYAAALL